MCFVTLDQLFPLSLYVVKQISCLKSFHYDALHVRVADQPVSVLEIGLIGGYAEHYEGIQHIQHR